MSKLTKAQVKDLARLYVADLLRQEQMPTMAGLSYEQEIAFMAEVSRISERVRASITPAGRAALANGDEGK